MNIKNSFIVLLMMSISVSEVYPMYCIVRQLPGASHRLLGMHYVQLIQKRNFGTGDYAFRLAMFMGTRIATLGVCLGYGVYKGVRWGYGVVQDLQYKNDAYKYVENCKYGFLRFDQQELSEIDEKGERYVFLLNLKRRHDQLSLVESIEMDKLKKINENNSDAIKH